MKKLMIAVSLIIVVILSCVFYYKITSIKLFEGVGTDSVDEIVISNIGTEYRINDKEQITEIINYLKDLTFRKTNKNRTNTSYDSIIALKDKDGKCICSICLYGDVAEISPSDKEQRYTTTSSIYDDIDKLCEKR